MELVVAFKPEKGCAWSCELHRASVDAVLAVVAAGPHKMFGDALATCLKNAAFTKNAKMVQALLSMPDKWTPTAEEADDALDCAAEASDLRCVEELMGACPMITPRGFTRALIAAVFNAGADYPREAVDEAKRIVTRLLQDGRADRVQALMHYLNDEYEDEDVKRIGDCVGVCVLLAPELGWVPTVEVAEMALHTAAVVNNHSACTETILELCPQITAQACSRMLDTLVQESCCAASRVEVVEALLKDGRAVPSNETLIAVAQRGGCAEMRLFAPHFVTALTALTTETTAL